MSEGEEKAKERIDLDKMANIWAEEPEGETVLCACGVILDVMVQYKSNNISISENQ